MDWNLILVWGLKSGILFFIIITACAYYTLSERVVSAFIQDRRGPNRAGPWGLLQPLADGIKFLTKEEVFPTNVNKGMYLIAPAISVSCAILAWSIIPFGGIIPLPEAISKVIGFNELNLQVANPDTGILFLLAISSLAVYGIILAGWSSNNKYSLMGAIRSTAQMISYELPLGLSLVCIILLSGSLKLSEINDAQKGMWFIFTLPGFISFFIFSVAMFAETNRLPFDLAEAESELVVGFHTEYGAFKFALFFIAEYMNMITMSCVVSLLFFGGYNVPFNILAGSPFQPLVGLGFFILKVLFFAFSFMWVRWTLPRFRYDQLMNIGWKTLIPWALFNIVLAATYVVYWGKYWKGLFT
ncbi:MAG: NADH-quinone oxidoreductase subunit NuoH [Leptospiraceae bacterium]|nr:NADH-quinone oxidoreductase subunit NuoH [Leptospiraceae bacterium]